MVKGNQREQKAGANTKYVGFTLVKLKAINPTRKELNELLGIEDQDDDKEINYITQDPEGNDRVRLSFWLHDEKLDKYFVHSFNLTNKLRTSKDGVKNQYINSSCITAWSDEEKFLPDWFLKFMDKDKNEIGKKEFRRALLGEEELATLLRSWLGRMSWNDPASSVLIDTKALLKQDYAELRKQIGGSYDTPFVILTGVRTDDNDPEKQYQQVYGKSFLPGGFMSYIEKGFKFKTDYAKKVWARFEAEVTGEYGFSSYFEMSVIKEYDPKADPAASTMTRVTPATPTNSKY